MRITAVRAYLLLGGLAIAAHLIAGGVKQIYECFGLAAAVAIVCGVALHRPRAWRSWLTLALAEALIGAGDILYFNVDGVPAGYEGLSSFLYFAGRIALGLALFSLVLGADGRRDYRAYLDGVVVAIAVGILVWFPFFDAGGGGISHGLSLGYPLLEIVVLTAFFRVGFTRAARSWANGALGSALILLIGADLLYIPAALDNTYVPGTWLDVGWLASDLLIGAAALHPSMRTIVKPRPVTPAHNVILLGFAVVAIAFAAVLQQALSGVVDVYPIAGAGALVSIFVVYRVAGLVRALERSIESAKASERRFRMVFERAPIGISIGRDGIMSETNPAYQEMLGYTGSELAQRHHLDVTHPDDRNSTLQREIDLGRKEAVALDKRLIRKDGSIVEVHVHVALDLDDGLGIGLVEDVTGRRELEDQLRQAQKMDSIGKLAGGIAHDFNNLMTAVIGYSDLLLQQSVTGPGSRLKVEAIRDSAVRASDLTRQLLAFSRRQILQTQEIDLREVVTKMDTLLKRLIGEDVRLRTLMGEEPVLVRADKTQLEQVVMNLAVNARDAMPDGGTLTVAVLSDGETAILSVVDDGVGMDEETRAQIFEPFFTTKPLAEASGLGLSTVHGIVGQSGGTLQVESELGVGTTFTIRLPTIRDGVLPAEPPTATLVD
jgi:PAS domain S-box-containing protein